MFLVHFIVPFSLSFPLPSLPSFLPPFQEGQTELSMEGAANVGSEMDRVHIAEKNKQMAAMLKVHLEQHPQHCHITIRHSKNNQILYIHINPLHPLIVAIYQIICFLSRI